MSQGVLTCFAGADPNSLFYLRDENLSIPDASGMSRLLDRLDRLLELIVAENNLDFYLGQEINNVLGPPIEFGVALLAAEALHLRDGDALQTDFVKGFLHLVELERLDDRFDLLHG